MAKSLKSNFFSAGNFYNHFFDPILAKDEGVDAENLTQIVLAILGQASIYRNWPGVKSGLKKLGKDLKRHDSRLEQKLFGCNFNNPIGLAAGLDKNGVAAAIWHAFGFGFAELGTITLHAQKGNPRPRLFRLANEQAALNRMGFNNNGAKKMQETLEKQKLEKPGERAAAIGLNLGKSKITTLEEAPNDYASSLEILSSLADYVVINVSSPNTPGLRDLQSSKQLRRLIKQLKSLKSSPPLLVKIAPDLDNQAIDNLAKLAQEEKLAGVIAVNTSLNRLGLEKRMLAQTGLPLEQEAGGISGRPLRKRGVEVIKRLRHAAGPDLPLIGVGGIDSPAAAWERISAGASLVQLYTGWIFEGPDLVPRILEGVLSQLDRHGFADVSEAIGSGAPWV